MKYLLAVITVAIILASCNNYIKFKEQYSHDLEVYSTSYFNSMLFINSNTGFIVGFDDPVWHNPDRPNSEFAPLPYYTAVLFRTTDGGMKWEKKTFDTGVINTIVHINNDLYVLIYNEKDSSRSCYCSGNGGDEWTKLDSFPKDGYKILSMDSTLICAGANQIYLSKDKGKHWNGPIFMKHGIGSLVTTHNGGLYYTGHADINEDINVPVLVNYNIRDNVSTCIRLPIGLEPYWLTNYSNVLKLTGNQEGYITIYTVQSDGKLDEGCTYKRAPAPTCWGFFNTKNESWIITGEYGNSYKHILTTDGKHWDEADFYYDRRIGLGPVCFLNEHEHIKAWIYNNLGYYLTTE